MKRLFRARDYLREPQRDVEEEFRSHLELKVEDLMSQGIPEKEAWAEARRAFGNPEENAAQAESQTGARLRREGLKAYLDTLSQDLSYAIRRMARAPGFTAAAIVSLAIGIGANTGVFSIVNALLLRPPPYENPHELVRIYSSYPGLSPFGSSSYPDYRDMKELDEVFVDLAAFYNILAPVTVGEDVRMSMVEAVSANFLSMLGVEPALGRSFLSEEDQEPGANPVVILGNGFWNRAFGADPEVLGSTLMIGGSAYTVVGVAPESYGSGVLSSLKSDLLVPLTQGAAIEGQATASLYSNRQYRTFDLEARLRPGVSLDEARVRLELFSSNLKEAYPGLDPDRSFRLMPASEVTLSPEIDRGLPLIAGFLLAVVGLVLLLACTNLASFLLAQGVNRRTEIAVRLAMGAPRRRLIRQLLSETILLGLFGGAVGILLASWTLGLLLGVLPQLPAPIDLELGLDGRVLVFSFFLSLLAGVLFGLVPALQSTSPDIASTLKDAGLAQGKRRHRLRSGLVALQMAISVILLVGGGLFVRSLVLAERIDPGFSVQGVGTAWIDLAMSGIPQGERAQTEALLRERLRSEPGIRSVATASQLPLAMGSSFQLFGIPGVEPPPGQDFHRIHYTQASPGFFRTMEVPILMGRDFTPQDQSGTPDVVVVSEALANRFWPGLDPIGMQIHRGEARRPATVIGVARDTKIERLGEAPLPFVYFSSAQYPTSFIRVVARGEGDANDVLTTLRRSLREMNPDFAIMDVRSMEDHLALLLFPSRVAALLFGVFGGLALLLCAIGLYGVVDFSVSARTREIGIRISLGAKRGDVVGSMMKDALKWVGIGGLVGFAAAVALARLIQGLLFGVRAGDPFTLTLVVLLLGGVAMVAAFVPARRATRVNPVEALRME